MRHELQLSGNKSESLQDLYMKIPMARDIDMGLQVKYLLCKPCDLSSVPSTNITLEEE